MLTDTCGLTFGEGLLACNPSVISSGQPDKCAEDRLLA